MKIFKALPLILGLFFGSISFAQALDFTGDVDADFSEIQNCWEDPNEVGLTGTGFDIAEVCFFYDGETDIMYVGVKAHDDAIVGDADGDGDPDASSVAEITDFASFGDSETFVLSFDLDGDSIANGFDADSVDLVVGISADSDFSALGAYFPSASFDPDYPAIGFGVSSGLAVTPFAAPSAETPDLEFSIADFKSLDLTYADVPVIQGFAGSVSAGVVGSDFLPSSSELTEEYSLYDFDSDGLEDWEELNLGTDPFSSDSDGDGLPDGVELNGDNPTDPQDADSDDDGLTDGEEDLDADGNVDDGESDPNDADTDDDGLTDNIEVNGANPTDPQDADSDDDGLTDSEEDADGDGEQDATETDPNDFDSDDGGVSDYIEVATGFDPLDPSDDAQAEQVSVQTGVGQGYDRIQGGGLNCQLDTQATQGSTGGSLLLLLGLLAMRFRKSLAPNRQ